MVPAVNPSIGAKTDVTVFPELVRGLASTDAHPDKVDDVPQQKEFELLVELAVTEPFRFAFVPAIPVAGVVCTVGATSVVVKVFISPYEYLDESLRT